MSFARRRVGEVRPSQVMHTFGIGSLVDLPNFSAIVMGLDDWEPPTPDTEIAEERLLNLVRSHLGPQVERLVVPPATGNESGRFDPFDPDNLRGIPVAPFPRWVRCPLCDLIAPLNFGVFSLKADPWRPDRTRYVHDNCPKARAGGAPAVMPVRFVRACEEGHIDDFPWIEFVHSGPTKCKSIIRLREFGVSAEAADIVVQCDTCGASRPMTLAFGEEAEKVLGGCSGHHPHLRQRTAGCTAEPKAMLAGASNLWFPVNVSALSIPTGAGNLGQLIKEHWPLLKDVTSQEVLAFARKQQREMQVFAEWSDDELWEAIEAERGGAQGAPAAQGIAELKAEEWAIFSNPASARRTDNFRLREERLPGGYERFFERVVLVERLRVVKALIGFTRIVSPGDFADIDEIPEIRRAPIARPRPSWVPAAEVRGEGLFLQIREETLTEWLRDLQVREREAEFRQAHTDFRRARRVEHPEANFPGIRYVLLHSLAHALIRQFSIECGYGAASLQERIYSWDAVAGDEPMAGILLYTAAADSEGTLGGLVNLGRPELLARHLDQALEDMRLCASDPLCSEHAPEDANLTLHGASCHACLFASETSCERGNKYLDRTLLVRTIGGTCTSFFDDMPVGTSTEAVA